MVLDFDMTCVIQAWGSPQVEGKVFQNKMESKDYFSPRMDVLFHCASYAMTNDWVPQFTRVGFEKKFSRLSCIYLRKFFVKIMVEFFSFETFTP